MTPGAFSVARFCEAYQISRALFYKLLKEGRGPAIMKVGRRTLISRSAATEWQEHITQPHPSDHGLLLSCSACARPCSAQESGRTDEE